FSFAALAILLVTIVIELSIRKNWLEYFFGRKLLHVFAIGTTAWMIDRDVDFYMLGMTLVAMGVL
ncbi:MAG: hypothetical protein ACK492_04315, partial [Chitinophagaceae bacterium]